MNNHDTNRVQSIPLPLTQTFAQYAQLGQRLRKHYLSPRVFLCLVSGQFVPPIHRKNLYSLQYSMLPVQRVGIGELWRLLTAGRKEKKNELSGLANGQVPNGTPNSVGKRGGQPHGKSKAGAYWWSR